jgi:tetratricopeptide (TPR) repeat protein
VELIERYRLAEAYLGEGAPLAALETLDPMRAELSGVAGAQLLLGRAYFHSAQLNRARLAFERVLALDPVEDYAHFALGRIAERLSRPVEAISHYRVAVALSPRPEYRARLTALKR